MNLRRKKPRPLTREQQQFRDDRLFIIATEDTYAPAQYFRGFRNPRIHVKVLPTEDGCSAPRHVLGRLEGYYQEYDLDKDDELWLLLDTDDWVKSGHVANLKEVCAQATQKGFHLAISNPCFEIWLLLHVVAIASNEEFKRCEDVEQRLKEILGKYNKRNIDCEQFSPTAAVIAVARARKLNEGLQDRWPQKTGSHVYRVVEKLLPQ